MIVPDTFEYVVSELQYIVTASRVKSVATGPSVTLLNLSVQIIQCKKNMINATVTVFF